MKILDGRKQSLYFDFTKIKRSKTIIFNNIKKHRRKPKFQQHSLQHIKQNQPKTQQHKQHKQHNSFNNIRNRIFKQKPKFNRIQKKNTSKIPSRIHWKIRTLNKRRHKINLSNIKQLFSNNRHVLFLHRFNGSHMVIFQSLRI